MIDLANIFHPAPKHKKYVIAGVVAGAVLLVGCVAGVLWAVMGSNTNSVNVSDTNTIQKKKKAVESHTPAPTTAARALDGLEVAVSDANIWPVCTMIENAAFDGVRPQAGLSRALVVYEVIVEGGITRLMAVYAGEDVSKIGPVRSARDTYLEFASELDCLYGHAGGSFTAMQAIRQFGLHDLDGLSANGRFYWRDMARYAPHNLFTSSELLRFARRDLGFVDKTPSFKTWNFRKQPADAFTDTTQERFVRIDFSTPSYEVRWSYVPGEGYYKRYNGGALQTDAATGDTVTARNVVVQMVPPGEYIEGKGRINFSVTGEGKVLIFRSGEVVVGTWRKADRLSRTQFFDAAGEEIELNQGNTWVEIVPTDRTVESYPTF